MVNRLGRGLDLLLGPKPETATPGALDKEIMLDSISVSSYQARKNFDEAGLKSLSDSIKAFGILEPVLVSAKPAGGYVLLAGERRLRAAKIAGLKTIPAIIKNFASKESALIGIVENVQRADLNPLELAQAVERLAAEFQLTHEEIAQLVGLSRPRVSNLLRLLGLDEEIQEYIAVGHLSEGQAKALLSLDDAQERLKLAREIAQGSKHWNVRDIERKKTVRRPDPNLTSLEEELQKALGTRVRLNWRGKNRSGWISIQFSSIEHFEGLKRRLIANPAGSI